MRYRSSRWLVVWVAGFVALACTGGQGTQRDGERSAGGGSGRDGGSEPGSTSSGATTAHAGATSNETATDAATGGAASDPAKDDAQTPDAGAHFQLPDGGTPSPPPDGSTNPERPTSTAIGEAGGVVSDGTGVELEVEPSSISVASAITVEQVDPPNTDGLVSIAVDLRPDGITFDPPALLTMPFDTAAAAGRDVVIAWLDDDQWVPLEDCTQGADFVTCSVAHFTIFGVVVRGGSGGAEFVLGGIERVNVAGDGAEANGAVAYYPSISEDGRRIAFDSAATNLVNDTNGYADVFVRDLDAKTTTLVSVVTGGGQANHDSISPIISANGDAVAFTSRADNLALQVENTSNQVRWSVFVHHMGANTTTLGSSPDALKSGSGGSLNRDGSAIVFAAADALVPADQNTALDIYFRRLNSSTYNLLSAGQSSHPVLTPDAGFVVFDTAASLVAEDTNDLADVYVVQVDTALASVASKASDGTPANRTSNFSSLSSDGRYVVFTSQATNLTANDTNDEQDVFRHDRQTGATLLISVGLDGNPGNDTSASWLHSVSDDGRYVVFSSRASNLVADDTNQAYDVFLRDTSSGTTARLSVNATGEEGDGHSTEPVISGKGNVVAFRSSASNLVPDDTNGVSDIFAVPVP